MQANNGSLGTVADERKIKELPLNGRNFFQLAQLVPNAFPLLFPKSSLSFRGDFNIAGQPEVNNDCIFDGLQKFKVLIGVSRLSMTLLRRTDLIITKSGANDIRGMAYEFPALVTSMRSISTLSSPPTPSAGPPFCPALAIRLAGARPDRLHA